MSRKFPFFPQYDRMDCGPTCLRMISSYYGKSYSLEYLREHSYLDREGVSIEGIAEAAEHIGFETLPIQVPFAGTDPEQAYFENLPLPCIVHWRQVHFVVVYRYSNKYVWVADPAAGKFKIDHHTFKSHWLSDGGRGIALVLQPTPDFYDRDSPVQKRSGIRFLWNYFRPYRQFLWQLVLGLFLASIFQLIFPFLTQALVDIGIQNQNLGFIYLILVAQLALFLGQTSVTIIQNWILLHIGTRINVSLVSDFLTKLMKLPISYFDTKMIGDLLQRIADQRRIEVFLTNSTLNFVFSAFNLVVFGFVLAIYDGLIFIIFLTGSTLYTLWIFYFLRRRKEIDYIQFQELSDNHSTLIEFIQGMQEIKLQNSGLKRRRQWSYIQAKLFNAKIDALKVEQWQDGGAAFISQLKDILITFLTAKLVLEGRITLGMMLAVQFIIGQLNIPLQRMIQFVRTAQDAKISFDRLLEIQQLDSEEIEDANALRELPEEKSFYLDNVSFRYNKLSGEVLKNVNLTIPAGKVTAIVGTSGSGKTTLIKLLLGFYTPSSGHIKVGNIPLPRMQRVYWRTQCGAVMQDGYIFSDTIANNIAESEDKVDKTKLLQAVKAANIQRFIESLPLRYNTKIGARGNGISQGQRQRLLIARAIYKNPPFMFFDEATNALDANNERTIVENLEEVFRGRTVVVVAHRLSTVRHADQIVVLDQGAIVERGDHDSLVQSRGAYYHLIKNQLELGA